MAEPTPWLIFEPDGTFDGLMWSPPTIEEAQRRFARPRRWKTLEREGWTVRKGEPGEHFRLVEDAIERHRATHPAPTSTGAGTARDAQGRAARGDDR